MILPCSKKSCSEPTANLHFPLTLVQSYVKATRRLLKFSHARSSQLEHNVREQFSLNFLFSLARIFPRSLANNEV